MQSSSSCWSSTNRKRNHADSFVVLPSSMPCNDTGDHRSVVVAADRAGCCDNRTAPHHTHAQPPQPPPSSSPPPSTVVVAESPTKCTASSSSSSQSPSFSSSPPPPSTAPAPNTSSSSSSSSYLDSYEHETTKEMLLALSSNDCQRIMELVDEQQRSAYPSKDVSSLSFSERRDLLQRYFTNEFVDAYCLGTGGTNGRIIAHDELIEALQKCPRLVVEETPAERYLIQCSTSTSSAAGGSSSSSSRPNATTSRNDPSRIYQAALKIANHWKLRKYFFGPQRAFLPMAQTTATTTTQAEGQQDRDGVQGALSLEDMEWFKTGFLVVLPKSCDSGNPRSKRRTLLALDVTRLPPYHASCPRYDHIKLRIAFYILFVVSSQNPAVQMNNNAINNNANGGDGSSGGIACISVTTTKGSAYFTHWALAFIREALPIGKYHHHSYILPSKMIVTARQNNKSFLSYAIALGRYFLNLVTGHLHDGQIWSGFTDARALQTMIESTRFNVNDIPIWMGGSKWDMDDFHKWIHKQRLKEMKQYLDKDMQTRIFRQRDAERAKQKRQRTTNVVNGMEIEKEQLQIQNLALQQENERLKRLCISAREQVIRYLQQEQEEQEPSSVMMRTTQQQLLCHSNSTQQEQQQHHYHHHPHYHHHRDSTNYDNSKTTWNASSWCSSSSPSSPSPPLSYHPIAKSKDGDNDNGVNVNVDFEEENNDFHDCYDENDLVFDKATAAIHDPMQDVCFTTGSFNDLVVEDVHDQYHHNLMMMNIDDDTKFRW